MGLKKILFIIGAVCFSIGAVVSFSPSTTLNKVNWLCAGAAFVAWSYV
jgi:hypothetical protein